MPTGRDFSREQWREIEEVRARLEAYKNKIQPYPPYPTNPEGNQPEELRPQVVQHLEEWFAEKPIPFTDNRYKQLKEGLRRTERLVKTLLENLKEHTEKKKRKSKYD